jgi:lactate dehydrogenase-like 2-hydroxyacid dehydrogenase
MNDEMNRNEKECRRPRRFHHGGSSGGIYGLGFIGACVYFIGQAATFGLGVLGFLKALVWPAILVFELLKYLNM